MPSVRPCGMSTPSQRRCSCSRCNTLRYMSRSRHRRATPAGCPSAACTMQQLHRWLPGVTNNLMPHHQQAYQYAAGDTVQWLLCTACCTRSGHTRATAAVERQCQCRVPGSLLQPQMAPGGLSVQLAHRAHTSAWTLLGVDVAAALAAQRVSYRCIRSLQLCAAMSVRGAFTSDIVYSPQVILQPGRYSYHGGTATQHTVYVQHVPQYPSAADSAKGHGPLPQSGCCLDRDLLAAAATVHACSRLCKVS
jgi:hypothetical protein